MGIATSSQTTPVSTSFTSPHSTAATTTTRTPPNVNGPMDIDVDKAIREAQGTNEWLSSGDVNTTATI